MAKRYGRDPSSKKRRKPPTPIGGFSNRFCSTAPGDTFEATNKFRPPVAPQGSAFPMRLK
jgi:hypothetical protein